jgi:hypothetical protein
MAPHSSPQDIAIYALLLECLRRYFNVEQAKEPNAELERLPKGDNNERWEKGSKGGYSLSW